MSVDLPLAFNVGRLELHSHLFQRGNGDVCVSLSQSLVLIIFFSPSGIADNLIEIHKRLRKLAVIHYDASNNLAALVSLIGELGRQARERQRTIISEVMTEIETLG